MQVDHIASDTSQGSPREAAGFEARPVRHLPLELVVELDRERDERVRQQRR